MKNVVNSIVEIDRCCSCGVCAGVCSHRILKMVVRENGDLIPRHTGACPHKCTLCLEVCPFETGIHDPKQVVNSQDIGRKHTKSYDKKDEIILNHKDVGPYYSSWIGYSEKHRANSSSGGLMTFCLEELLCRGEVDVVAVPGQNSPKNGVQFSFRMIDSPDKLIQYSGSVYQPVEISNIIGEMLSNPERKWAITAVPCLCTGIKKAVALMPKLKKTVKYILGLACGIYQNSFYTEFLIKKSGLRFEETRKVEYRIKPYKDHANNYGFRATDCNGEIGPVIKYKGLPFFLGSNGYFRLNACNFCKDVFAENADACFMDAWLPEYKNDPRGTSLVLIRNKKLEDILQEGTKKKHGVHVERIPIERVIESQAGHVHRKRNLIEMRLGLRKRTGNLLERFQWWLQKRTQARSKWAWAKIGRRYGVIAFWLMMSELWIFQKIIPYLKNAARYKNLILANTCNSKSASSKRKN